MQYNDYTALCERLHLPHPQHAKYDAEKQMIEMTKSACSNYLKLCHSGGIGISIEPGSMSAEHHNELCALESQRKKDKDAASAANEIMASFEAALQTNPITQEKKIMLEQLFNQVYFTKASVDQTRTDAMRKVGIGRTTGYDYLKEGYKLMGGYLWQV